MEQLFSTICDHAEWAPQILFLLLMIAGLNIPISEDIILITGGAITALCIPEHHLKMFLFLYFGCWMSAWECYALGRFFGPKLYEIPWFNHWINPASVEKLHKTIDYYKYLTFFVIRFIPGGIRNTFFMTCGLGKMPFKTFIFRDGMAVLLSSNVLFYIGYEFADHYHEIVQAVHQYSNYFLLFVLSVIGLVVATLVFNYIKNKSAK